MIDATVKSGVAAAGEVFPAAVLSLNGLPAGAKPNPDRDRILAMKRHARLTRAMGQMTPPLAGDGTTKQSVVETVRRMRVCMGVIDPLIRCSSAGGYAGLPYCKEHAYDTLATLRNHQLEEAAAERLKARDKRAEEVGAQEAEREERQYFTERQLISTTSPGVVYYLLVGTLIKIGWTSDLRQRLKAYPPDTKVLAVHPGTLETEKQMHTRFAHLLDKGREWFRDDTVIRDHAAEVVEQYGEPILNRKKPAPKVRGVVQRLR